jgi:hypothetical protein
MIGGVIDPPCVKQAFGVRTLQLPVNLLDYGQSRSQRAASHG